MKIVLVLALLAVSLLVASPALASDPLPPNPFVCLPEDTTVCDLYDDPVGTLTGGAEPCKIGNQYWC